MKFILKILFIGLLGLLGTAAQAQNLRYNDILLKTNGGFIAGAAINVCTGTTYPLTTCVTGNASLYGSSDNSRPIPNPVYSDNAGNLWFWAPNGDYTLTVTASGINTYSFAISLGGGADTALKPAASLGLLFASPTGASTNDGLSWGSSLDTPQHCITPILSLSGGTCETAGSFTLTGETDIGNSSNVPVSLTHPNGATWQVNVSGSACGFRLYDKSSFTGPSGGNGQGFIIEPTSGSVSADSLLCNDPTNGQYFRVKDVVFLSQSGATFTNGLLDINGAEDDSLLNNVNAVNYSGIGFRITNSCCAFTGWNIGADGGSDTIPSSAAQPFVIAAPDGSHIVTSTNWFSSSINHPSAGYSNITLTGPNIFWCGSNNWYGLHMEADLSGSDTTTPAFDDGCYGGVGVYGARLGNDVAGSTRYMFKLESSVQGGNFFGVSSVVSKNIINDVQNGYNITTASALQPLNYSTLPTYFLTFNAKNISSMGPELAAGSCTVATLGFIRMCHGDLVEWENNAGGGNDTVGFDSSDRLNVNAAPVAMSSQLLITTSFTTTAATSDNVTVTGMTSSGHCFLEPTNSGAAGGIAGVYISAKTTNQITVTHAATSGWTFDVGCTPY